MGHDDGSRVFLEQPFCLIQAQAAVFQAGDAGKGDTCFFQLYEGTHDGIVLHRGYEHVVARLQKAFQDDV